MEEVGFVFFSVVFEVNLLPTNLLRSWCRIRLRGRGRVWFFLFNVFLSKSNFDGVFSIIDIDLGIQISDGKMGLFFLLELQESLTSILLIIFHQMQFFNFTEEFKDIFDILFSAGLGKRTDE